MSNKKLKLKKRRLRLVKQAEPVTVDGLTRTQLISEVTMNNGKFTKVDAGYREPADDRFCGTCRWFVREEYPYKEGMQDNKCQLVRGEAQWYGTCRFFISAEELIRFDLGSGMLEMTKAEDRPPRALPVSLRDAELSTRRWQGSREVAAMDVRQLRNSTLAFVGGDPESKSNYKLPYRDRRGRINVNAVRAIRAVLGGARGGVDLPDEIRPAVERAADRLWKWVQSQMEQKSFDGVQIVKNDPMKRLVYGVVLEPDVEDAHGDVVSAEDIEKACHMWQRTAGVVLLQHDTPIDAEVVENYIAPTDFEVADGRVIKAGSWIQVTKVYDDGVWKEILSGDRTGYSFGGWAVREPIDE